MSDAPSTSYDEMPYGSNVFYYTHPDRLATVAALMGMATPPVDRCRVLELGCGTGANLIPMAQDLPGSHFVGIDLSPRQVATGQAMVEALRLPNLELKAASILDVDDSLGTFDFIICHGVYSWVPPDVQDKILAVCAGNLSPTGVAYVSYNTYPGWHVRGMIREMMGYHVRRFAEPHVRVQQARAILDFLIQAVGTASGPYSGPYGASLKAEATLLARATDTYLYHEHLEEVNHPIYFHQFAERAAAKGLQYLGEAQPTLLAANLSAEVVHTLEEMSEDLIQAEQYLDFVRNRTFRRTLLCHDRVPLQRPPSPKALTRMHVTGLVKPVTAQPDIDSESPEAFESPDGARLSTNNPLLKAALVTLAEFWPQSVPFETLWSKVRSRLARGMDSDAHPLEGREESLAEGLLQCYLSNLVELHVHAPRLVVDVGERPLASPLARWQAAAGETVTNLRHRSVELGDFERLLLPYLDGCHDRTALLDCLGDLVAQEVLTLDHDGEPLRDPEKIRAVLGEALGPSLRRLAGCALIMA